MKIWPSVMSKNQKELNSYLKELKGVSKTLHLDIVDGKFADSKAMWFPFRLFQGFNYNVHLMIKNPEKWIQKNIKRKKKISLFIPQFEEVDNIDDYISWMKKEKKKVAFAILPETKVKKLKPYLNKIDYVLVLTVHPGYYGSKFLPKNLRKIKQIKKINPKTKVIVDGGVKDRTIKKINKYTPDILISGSYIKNAVNKKLAINYLKHVN
jgi:ribulose-phosphate 3-epimerase